MADPVSIAIIAVVSGSVAALAWYTSRRHWNVDREDDALREEEDGDEMTLVSEDEEEG